MLDLLVTLLVLCLVFGLLWWVFITLLPLPEPFAKVAKIVIALLFVFILIGLFFGGIDVPTLRLRS